MEDCYKFAKYVHSETLPIYRIGLNLGEAGFYAKCPPVKARWESNTGCCYLTFPIMHPIMN